LNVVETDMKSTDANFQRCLGRALLDYGSLIVVLQVAIWKLAGLDDSKGKAIVSHLSDSQLQQVFFELIRLNPPKHGTANVASLKSRSNAIINARNDYFHSAYGRQQHEQLPIVAYQKVKIPRGSSRAVMMPVLIGELEKFVKDIRQLRTDLGAFLTESYNLEITLTIDDQK
jgi:Rad3-related DNA helicase